jgi:hypothetical protein
VTSIRDTCPLNEPNYPALSHPVVRRVLPGVLATIALALITAA